jgi:hypothetical protein
VELQAERSQLAWLRPLRVRVVDPESAPMGGVLVELRSLTFDGKMYTSVMDRAESHASTGIAEFDRQRQRERLTTSALFGNRPTFEVGCDAPFVNAPRLAVSSAALRVSHPLGEGRNERWFNLNSTRSFISQDQDGGFVVRGLPRVPEFGIRAQHGTRGASGQVRAARGTTDLRAVLQRSDGRQNDSYIAAKQFLFRSAPPGTAVLEIVTAHTGWSLQRIDDLEVRLGEWTQDQRLIDIDLRGQLGKLELVLIQENGRPFHEAQVWLRDAHGRGSAFTTDSDGSLSTLAPLALTGVWVSAPDHAALMCTPSPAQQTLAFSRL